MMQIKSFQHALINRYALYSFLGRSLHQAPDAEALLQSAPVKQLKELVSLTAADPIPGLPLLNNFLLSLPCISEKAYQEMCLEYHRLLVGPSTVFVPPWESVYRSSDKIILNEHTLLVRESYRHWNLEISQLGKTPDDHMGFELEFISLLILDTLKHLKMNDLHKVKLLLEGQKAFFETHLLLWQQQFFRKLEENTEHPFYQGIALFVPYFLDQDYLILDTMVSS